jgi:hypothetical protein
VGVDLAGVGRVSVSDARPTVALVATTYFAGSHADVIGTRLMRGYEWLGRFVRPRVRVASLYISNSTRGDGCSTRRSAR